MKINLIKYIIYFNKVEKIYKFQNYNKKFLGGIEGWPANYLCKVSLLVVSLHFENFVLFFFTHPSTLLL